MGHEDGMLSIYNASTGECTSTQRIHDDAITDFQFNADKSCFITSSKDHSSKVAKFHDPITKNNRFSIRKRASALKNISQNAR